MDGSITTYTGDGLWAMGDGRSDHGGATVIRPTVIGVMFCCDRRAQSSSSTSRQARRVSGIARAIASRARSREAESEKKIVRMPSWSSTAVGE